MSVLSCNACNEKFAEETDQREHYRSEWHRYNLKRRVAGLPGVTSLWFHKRQQTLAASQPSPASDTERVLHKCLPCQKEYSTSKALTNHFQSKSHKLAVTGGFAGLEEEGGDRGYSQVVVRRRKGQEEGGKGDGDEEGEKTIEEEEEEEDEEEGEGEWEEVGEEEAAAISSGGGVEGEGRGGEGEEEGEVQWDVSECLFCGRKARGGSMADCVEHMHRSHGFFIPDAEFLAKPKELLEYLGLKVSLGHICLVCDDRGKPFASLASVRQHMVASCHCKLRWGDGTGVAEEELEEFYDYSASYGGAENMEMVLSQSDDVPVALSSTGLELIIKAEEGKPERVIGSRELAKFYKQRHKPSEHRDSVLVGALVARYKSLGLATKQPEWVGRKGKLVDSGVKAAQRAEAIRTRVGLKANVIRQLPKNVPH